MSGQVTIGADIPPAKGALLDLKQTGNSEENSQNGLLLPKVLLTKKAHLYPMFETGASDYTDEQRKIHTGLIVYNLTNDPEEDLCPGTYEWSGKIWERLSYPCTFFEFLCSTISVSQYYQNVNIPFEKELTIKYNSGFSKNLTTPIEHSYDNGLTIKVAPQAITQGVNQTFTFTISGDGNTPAGIYVLPLIDLQSELDIKFSSNCLPTVIISAPTLDLFCAGVSAEATAGVALNTTVQVPYSLSRAPYTVPAGNIGAVINGITPSIAVEQTLSTLTGNITVTLTGTPTTTGKISVPITIGGSNCNIEVNVKAPFEFICSSLKTGQYTVNERTVFEEDNEIKYNSSIQKVITTPMTHTYGNGLSITIRPQTISQTTNGTLYFSVSSNGTAPRGIYSLLLSELSSDLGFEISSTNCAVSVVVSAPQVTLYCNTTSTPTGELGVYMKKAVMVPAVLDRIPYTLPVGDIGQPVSGITPRIASAQTLTSQASIIMVTLEGTPTSAGLIAIPITIGNASCFINLNVSAPFLLNCSDIYITGFVNQDIGDTSQPVTIPYTMSSGSFALPAGDIGKIYGVTAYVEAQTLSAPSGSITVKFRGTPTQTLDKVPFPIDIQGNSCSIHLSVINPPTICPNGSIAKAFVFKQNNKWYVVTGNGSYNISASEFMPVASTIECNSEEEALRHPDALQYCGNITDPRCIRLFDRHGAFVTNVYMSQRSAAWNNSGGLAEANTGCWNTIKAYSGSKIESVQYKVGYLGAVNLSNGVGYLGTITGQEAILTDKPLR
ncbi:hypothetical protein D0T57_04615 [Dysgonomonas sp. 511]|nr:hypothetical protein [Dysgonomonas sp. 511]